MVSRVLERPCGPKSRVMFKHPWALTQDTIMVIVNGNRMHTWMEYPLKIQQSSSNIILKKYDSRRYFILHNFWLYYLAVERWSPLQTAGMKPPPSSFFSYTAITSHHALLFGGHQPAKGYCTNDLYLMDYIQGVCTVGIYSVAYICSLWISMWL